MFACMFICMCICYLFYIRKQWVLHYKPEFMPMTPTYPPYVYLQKLDSIYPPYVYLLHFTYLLNVTIFPTTWLSRLPLYPTPHGLESTSGPSGPFFHGAPQPFHSSPIFLIVSQLPQPLCVLGLWACWPVPPYYSSVSHPVSLAVVLTSLVEGDCYYFLKRLYIFCLFIEVYFTCSKIHSFKVYISISFDKCNTVT